MKFFTEEDASHVREKVDCSARNKFSWGWLNFSVDVVINKEVTSVKLEKFIRKPELEGKAWCTLCECDIKYASRGRIALVDHVKSKSHIRKMETVMGTQSIKSMFLVGQAPTVSPAEPSVSEPSVRDLVKAPVPLFDRVSNAEVCIKFSIIFC